MFKSQSISNLSKALLEAQKTMGDATKGSKNPFFKSSYADLNSIREVVIPALNAQGISVLQPTIFDNGKNYVETVLLHESGEFISGFTEIKNIDGKAQSEGSGISYARRYGLQSTLNVGAVDDDGEAAQGRSLNRRSDETNQAKPESRTETTKTAVAKKEATPATASGPSVAKTPTSPSVLPSESPTPFTDTKILRQKIKSAFAVLEAQKKITKKEFVDKYLEGGKVDTLSDDQVSKTLGLLKTTFKELGL